MTQKIEFGATKLLHMDYSKRLHYAKFNHAIDFTGGMKSPFYYFATFASSADENVT